VVLDVPPPHLPANGVLVQVAASVISSGTERAKIDVAGRSLVGKARARPDLARKVADQVRTQGLRETANVVRDRLGTPQPLGYSAAGTVLKVGAAAEGLQPGDLVACAGAGHANHAEVIAVPSLLCATVPAGVSAEQAAFATIGSIALHGLRQARVDQGSLVVVTGLGLVGQLAVRICRAYGHDVVGVDPSPAARREVSDLGVPTFTPASRQLAGVGADAVLICAATDSDDPVQTAPTWCRDRGTVVVVGDVGLGLQRPPYYDREIQLRFSRSYGPGRYDESYEEQGHDYPVGYVRWTEGRNLAEVLRLIGKGLLAVDDLISARFPIEEAAAAYDRLIKGPRVRAVLLTYDSMTARSPAETAPAPETRSAGRDQLRVGVCGAGNFARKTLLPGLKATGQVSWAGIATASGLTAAHVASRERFAQVYADPSDVVADPAADAVVIATRHSSHAEIALRALDFGKHVFVEKPLAITRDELDRIAAHPKAGNLVTGFNRRWAPASRDIQQSARDRAGPLMVDIRVNAGPLDGHWVQSADEGGRLVGELCHFVDLAVFLCGRPVRVVSAVGAGRAAPTTEESAQVLLSFDDGSTAAITYLAFGSAALPKERVEVHWDGHSAVIDDFRRWTTFDARRGRSHGGRRQDKGHRTLLAEFVRYARTGGPSPVPIGEAVHSSDATFAVIESLASGSPVRTQTTTW
jgi:predicted dehydrogenase/NADPH:quinone reductase-like Zn-dependent oxidoreductase